MSERDALPAEQDKAGGEAERLVDWLEEYASHLEDLNVICAERDCDGCQIRASRTERLREAAALLRQQCDHEACIAEQTAGFEETLDQALERAE